MAGETSMSTLLVENIRHEDATSPTITLDANGNVGFTTTDTNPVTNNVAGTSILSGGGTRVSRSGEPGGYNRIGSDGTLINFRKDGATVGKIGTVSGKLVLGGGPSAGSDVTIDDDGRVGIGTTSPQSKLQVDGNVSINSTSPDLVGNTTTLTIGNSSGGGDGMLSLQSGWGNTTYGRMFASGGIFKIGNPQSNKLVLYTANLDRLQIEDNGDIKIINPAASPVNGVNLPGSLIFEGNGWNTSDGSRTVQGQIHLWGGYNNPTGGSVEPALVFSLKGTGNGSYSTADGPDVLTERMRLDNYGNLTLDGNFTASGSVIASGTVLQVQSTVVTARNSTNVTDADGIGGDIGLRVDLTPKSSNSKFLVILHIGIGTTTGGNTWGIILSRDGSRVGNGDFVSGHQGGVWVKSVDHTGNSGTDTNHGVGAHATYLDTTSGTSGTSMRFEARGVVEGSGMYINRVESDYSGGSEVVSAYTSSSLVVMEIEK